MSNLSPPGESVPLNFPEPFEGTLPGSPLALVACQIRYGDPNMPPSALRAAAMREALTQAGFNFSKVDQVNLNTLTLNVASGAVDRAHLERGWRLQSSDGRWIATITPDSVALETTRYRSWTDDFRARLHGLLRAFHEVIEPSVETRLGLRYVDVITHPEAPTARDWRGRIADWMLGPIADDLIGHGIVNTQQQFTLDIDDDVRAIVRHGAYADASRENAYTYLLDTDIYRESLRQYSADDVETATDRFHGIALSLFQRMITPALLETMRSKAAV